MIPCTPPIQPSAPPPVYCAECGCEVYPIAWLCATCGKNLHEPGAMTSMRPGAPAPSKKSDLAQSKGGKIFAFVEGTVCVIFALVLVRYLYSDELIKDDPNHRYLLKILPCGLRTCLRSPEQ
jgi:hypothetical protein